MAAPVSVAGLVPTVPPLRPELPGEVVGELSVPAPGSFNAPRGPSASTVGPPFAAQPVSRAAQTARSRKVLIAG